MEPELTKKEYDLKQFDQYIYDLKITDAELETLVVEHKINQALAIARAGHQAVVEYLLYANREDQSALIRQLEALFDMRPIIRKEKKSR